ncbi:hypothetical protein [Actinoplanes sp. L3-i22]|uniref:hypothetical protein n=1 Tax=Actinoplanes sp. L3-i22 TaxID=2836373 RepID=UPI001C786F08|nr:hypothetical protein [Actinoplanes sp. L3-i22]BCY12079.1 hypothetical protein L3i22_071670 [Actinoplanes sp. L3-i22]
MTTRRATGWGILLTLTGLAVGGVATARLIRHRRPAVSVPPPSAEPDPPPGLPPVEPSGASRSLVRMAVAAAVVVVLCLVTVVATRPADRGREPSAEIAATDDFLLRSIDRCRLLYGPEQCGPATTRPVLPLAEPTMDTDGYLCVRGADRPVLDTVWPKLSATSAAGTDSTFQITGVDRSTAQDRTLPGRSEGGKAVADLHFTGGPMLAHGESYQWRVRGASGGWSPWCEFTVGKVTSDDLGLDTTRSYQVVLPAAKWRAIRRSLEPIEWPAGRYAHARIERILTSVSPTAARVPVTLPATTWEDIVGGLAFRGYQTGDFQVWMLADLVSTGLGGPEHPNAGWPRD